MMSQTGETTSDQEQASRRVPYPDTLTLLQLPKRWTARHLELAKVQKKYTPISGIIDTIFLPSDDDPGKLLPSSYWMP